MIIDAPLPGPQMGVRAALSPARLRLALPAGGAGVREATAEIQKIAKKEPALAATGAALFLEKVSPALEQVDNSSGAIGIAVNLAIEACAKVIAAGGSGPTVPENAGTLGMDRTLRGQLLYRISALRPPLGQSVSRVCCRYRACVATNPLSFHRASNAACHDGS